MILYSKLLESTRPKNRHFRVNIFLHLSVYG